mmetsp:Transcript_30088/g.82656  ORF Transcript_30088/g.82656 Transcript_30088/m.82656 type:complete len:292 (-) Transcript_30088:223-1098(-)
MLANGATSVAAFVLLLATSGALADHPCEAEVSSACPDRPPSEVGACLKNPSEHENPTTLSSECTDFIALNAACASDIAQFCDSAFFSQDTVLCLTTWVDADSLTQKCASVMKWAIPNADDEEKGNTEGPTDELGMSQKDLEEKKEWQAKRKQARNAAIDRMKMKEADAAKEKERVELETMKRERPDEYARLMELQEAEKRQAQEIKRRERLTAAALERKRKKERGEIEDEPSPSPNKGRKAGAAKSKGTSWVSGVLGLLVLGFVGLIGLRMAGGTSPRSKSESGKKKKKRG